MRVYPQFLAPLRYTSEPNKFPAESFNFKVQSCMVQIFSDHAQRTATQQLRLDVNMISYLDMTTMMSDMKSATHTSYSHFMQ